MSKRKSITNLVTEIQTLAMVISDAEVEAVTVNYDGQRRTLYVAIGDRWSVYVPMQHDELQFQLMVIRDRLDRLMDRVDLGRVA